MDATLPRRDETPIRDLPDFVLRWQEFRPHAIRLLHIQALGAEEQKVVSWLIQMADKITVRDVQG